MNDDARNHEREDATVSKAYYLTFMCGSTCFGRVRLSTLNTIYKQRLETPCELHLLFRYHRQTLNSRTSSRVMFPNSYFLLFFTCKFFSKHFRSLFEIPYFTIQINQPTRCNSFTTSLFDSIYLPDHDQQRSKRHAPTVKPEAPSAAVRS
jgi:hypothetical protein